MTKTVLIKTMLETYPWPEFSERQADSMVALAKSYGDIIEKWKEFQALRPGHSPSDFRVWFLEDRTPHMEFR